MFPSIYTNNYESLSKKKKSFKSVKKTHLALGGRSLRKYSMLTCKMCGIL